MSIAESDLSAASAEQRGESNSASQGQRDSVKSKPHVETPHDPADRVVEQDRGGEDQECLAKTDLATPWLDFNARLQLKSGGKKKERSEKSETHGGFRFPGILIKSKDEKSADKKKGAKPGRKNTRASKTSPDAVNETGDSSLTDDWDLHIPEKKTVWSGWEGLCVMIAGVLLPALIIGMSLMSIPKRMTLVLLNHPVETLAELLLICAVPLANYFIWSALCKNTYRFSLLRGLSLGGAIGTSVLTIVVSIAAVFAGGQLQSEIGSGFGVGFTCIALLFLLTALSSLYLANRTRLTHDFAKSRLRVLMVTIAGGFLSLLAFAAAEARPWYIRIAEFKTTSTVPKEREEGWKVLRQMNPEKEILMECSDARAVGLCGLFLPIKASTQHQLYFALTGKPYSFKDITNNDLSSMPDDYLSRHVVGDKLPGLSLTRSSLTGMLHPDTLSSTLDWTFVFKNQSQESQEARAEIGLPPGAVITGLTLWNKGEPKEGAFAASGKAEKYLTSTNSAGHDSPAVITDLGHGRMLLHCYPVSETEELKVRVTMVMPMKPDGLQSSTLSLPRLIAENFQIDNEHQIRLKSRQPMVSTSSTLSKGKNADGTQALSGSLSKEQIETANVLVSAQRGGFLKPVVALDKVATEFKKQEDYKQAVAEARRNQKRLTHKLQEEVLSIKIDASKGVQKQLEDLTDALEKRARDARLSPEQQARLKAAKPEYVVENINKIAAPAPKNLIVVLDGSSTLKDSRDALVAALSKLPENVPTRILLAAGDENSPVPMSLKQGIDKLKSEEFIGGHDNLKSVVKASELAGESNGGAVLWIHGPQPVMNQEIYIMEPFVSNPAFYELPLGAGDTDTYDFFKNHTEIGPFSQVPRSSTSVKDDLLSFFSKWKADINGYEVSLGHSTDTKDAMVASEDETAELVALRANKEVTELMAARHIRKAARTAVAYGLVTPVSCALVTQTSNNDTDIDDAALANKGTDEDQDDALSGSTLFAKALPGGLPGASANPNNVSTDAFSSGGGSTAPSLSGATNGSIGPQGTDATYVTGVNTAGTVRVNNLANLEALLNIIANGSELGMALFGAIIILNSLVSESVVLELLGQEIELSRSRRMLIGVGIILLGMSVPGLINWFVASARDANLFS